MAALLAGFALAISAGGCDNQNDIAPEPSGGAGGSGGSTALACPSGLPGPALVKVETSQGVTYCMDQREVTFAEYRAFISAKAGNTAGQPSECSWNINFAPEYGDAHTTGYHCLSGSEPTSEQQAANCIDFCDALAYCEWAGKRLCGRVGGSPTGTKVDIAAQAGATAAELEALSKLAGTSAMEFGYACTQANKTTYAYGNAYEPGRCIDATWVAQKGTSSLQIADLSNRTCHGSEPPFNQVYDLSGSVEEWQNLCTMSPGLGCLIIGGSSSDYDGTRQACSADVGFPGSAQQKTPYKGFRCCADGVPVSSP